MTINYQAQHPKDIEHRFHNFILFEPASLRLPDQDILFLGPEVTEYYYDVLDKVDLDDSLKNQIIKNRITKIGQMINLLKSDTQLIMTKFFDNVWKRHNFVSNLGEYFLDFPTFKEMFPEVLKTNQDLFALRNDTDDDQEEDNNSEETEESTEAVVETSK